MRFARKAALANRDDAIYFDSASTGMRPDLIRRAIGAGKHVYTEKPVAPTLADALDLYRRAQAGGVKHGVVQDKLWLPGLLKLKVLIDSGFFGRIQSVRGELGYWVFEGDWQPAQRPSWNYRKEDDGGIIVDMLCHWRYVLDQLFDGVKSVACIGATHIPQRFDESGKAYKATAEDAAYAMFELENGVIAQINSSWCTRVRLDDLVTFHVDGTLGSAVAGLTDCFVQPRAATPKPVWNPDAFAATHVVAAPLAAIDPWLDAAIDWDATLAYRRYLWSLGFAVAEAMDTAQRGMGLDWSASLQLIKRTVADARDTPGAVVFSGAGTDHVAPDASAPLERVIGAYQEQCAAIEGIGGRIILMASRALVASARSSDDYARVYGRVLSQVREPVILHWLGEMFDPALAGYWVGHAHADSDHARALDVFVEIIRAHASKIDGIKISLLDADKEVALRGRLPAGIRMYTGDDFNFAPLIGGDARGHSDALLGIFDAIAPVASVALTALASGARAAFDRIVAPTVAL